jgi:Zeta toxin
MLFDEYNADRARYRVAVHPAATWIRDELFRRALAGSAPQVKNSVVFTAGSNAAGKSTAIALTEVHQKAHAIFDSTFSNPHHACVLIEQALAAGKRIIILYIHRPLSDAMIGMLDRSRSEGRVVLIDQLVNSYRGAAETVRLLWNRYRDDTRFAFRFVANSTAGTWEESIDLTRPRDYTEIKKDLHELLDSEYRSGRITKTIHDRVRGGGD